MVAGDPKSTINFEKYCAYEGNKHCDASPNENSLKGMVAATVEIGNGKRRILDDLLLSAADISCEGISER